MTISLLIDEIETNIESILSEMGTGSVEFAVEPSKGFGDMSCNVAFLVAKETKRLPFDVARDIADRYHKDCLGGGGFVSGVTAHRSGYVNFDVDVESFARSVIPKSFADGYGSLSVGGGVRVVVEHTSVNPNKALHVGHVRNIVIGDTVSRILCKAGYHTSVLYYVDDSGLQVADIVLGFKKLGFSTTPPDGVKFDRYCGDTVYVNVTKEYEKRPELQEMRRDILREIEQGTTETARFADKITKRVLQEQLKTCWDLSVQYDCLNYESQIVGSGLWSMVFSKMREMRLVELEDEGKNKGCWVIRGNTNDKNYVPDRDDKVLVRSNGTATYMAKDIPYAAWKLGLVADPFGYVKYDDLEQPSKVLWSTTLDAQSADKKNFIGKKAITVIDSRQGNLQKMITDLVDRFGGTTGMYVHLGYESVTLSAQTADAIKGVSDTAKPTIQMSGRSGLYVNADDVYETLMQKVHGEVLKRNPDVEDSLAQKVARDVAAGTIRYEMIKQDLDKQIVFDADKSLSLEGNTSPYIQYTYARACRILEKYQKPPSLEGCRYESLLDPSEKKLLMRIGMFEEAVRGAAENMSPKVMAKYCYDLSVVFNSFYEHIRVLDGDFVDTRVCLVESFRRTLKEALSLLGIAAPNKM